MADDKKLNIEIKLKDSVSKPGGAIGKMFGDMKSKVLALLNPYALATAAIAAIGWVIVKGLSTWSQLEDRMINVGNLTNASREEIDEMTKSLVATKENQGLTQDLNGLSEALFDVVSAGVPVSESLEFLAVASKLATAGVTTTTVGVDGLTSVMNAYNMEASDAEGIADKFFAAQQKGSTTIEQLASSVGKVAPLTASMNISFAETVSAMSAITLSGIKTAEATTGLRAAISNVIKPTKEASDLAKELGLDFSATALKSKKLAGFLKDVQEKTGGNTDAMATLFGSIEALNTVLAISANEFKNLNEVQIAVTDSVGTLEKANEVAMSSMSNQWALLKGHVSSTLVLFVTPLAKATTFAIKTLNNFISGAKALFTDTAEDLLKENADLQQRIDKLEKTHHFLRNNNQIEADKKLIALNLEKIAKLKGQKTDQTNHVQTEEEKQLNATLEAKNKEVAAILLALNTEKDADAAQKTAIFDRFKQWKLEEEAIRNISHADELLKLEELLTAEDLNAKDRKVIEEEIYGLKKQLRIDDEKDAEKKLKAKEAAAQLALEKEKRLNDDRVNFFLNAGKAIEENDGHILKAMGNALKQYLKDELNMFIAKEQAKLAVIAIANWWNPIGWTAAGQVALLEGAKSVGVSAINSVKFADGGVIDSKSTIGDKTNIPMGRFNGNELISNPKQQANLLHAISNNRSASTPQGGKGGGSADLKVILNVDGVKLADGVVKNYNRARQLNLITTLKD